MMKAITPVQNHPDTLMTLPAFGVQDYERLVASFCKVGYTAKPVSERSKSAGIVYFRHDIDFFMDGWQAIPEIEHHYGVKATYYILPSSYNILNAGNRKLIRKLVTLGHEIGLHFDPTQYPPDARAGREQFDFEINTLESVSGQKIKTVARHNVFRKKQAKFDFSDYIDPWDESFREDMIYISDSTRAWRDETLLSCFGDNPPQRVQLLTHPELWLNEMHKSRIAYMRKELFPRMDLSASMKKDYLNIWTTHEAAQLHDKRVSGGEK